MERLIGDLLDMAGIQAGRLAVEKKPEDLRELLSEALDLQEALAREKGLRLVRELELDGATVPCDRGRVHQVLTNLIGNAIKFCSPGDTITVRATRRERDVEIAIRDTGPGIAPGALPHVFDPYWSAREHAQQGTGLGLYIARGIVEAHGGRMGATSELGVGSTFTFTLPQV